MCRVFAAATLLIGIATFVPAQEPSAGKSITQLIGDLGNQDHKVRETAAKAIEALGPEALPALRKAKDHPDIAARSRDGCQKSAGGLGEGAGCSLHPCSAASSLLR